MYFALQNLTAGTVFKVEKPWEWRKPAVYESLQTKNDYSRWCKTPSTEHMFFSGIEGLDPAGRVITSSGKNSGINNVPFKMHAFVCDFDGAFNGQPDIDKVLQRPPADYMPAYAGYTYSNHCRAIWQFEAPILLAGDPAFVKKFLQILIGRTKAARWFAGFDAEAAARPEQYYEAGRNWLPVRPDYAIPSNLLQSWLFEASKTVSFATWDRGAVPLEIVKLEIDKRWPEKLKGPLIEGARCHRFWDPQATNDSAAVIHPDGLLCFSGDKPFMSWKDLFGAEWIDMSEADKMEQAVAEIWYESLTDKFHRQSADGVWHVYPSHRFTQYLRNNHFESKRQKGETSSQIDKIEGYIQEQHMVKAVMPFVYEPAGIIVVNKDKFLNNCTTSVIQPVPADNCPSMTGNLETDGKKYFPFIYSVIHNLFGIKDTDGVDQAEYLMAWIKHFYENALALQPKPGQALFLVGREGKGKTLFGTGILGALMGGTADGSSWLCHGSQWTDDLVNKGLIVLDDSQISNDDKATFHRYCARLKMATANPNFRFEGKYKAAALTRWNGRVLGLCNGDPESLKILPTLESSNVSKISMLLLNDKMTAFPDRYTMTELIREELAYFARFLLTFRIPDFYLNKVDTRFHLIAYKHPQLAEHALQAGHNSQILDILQYWMLEYKKLHSDRKTWSGTCVELFQTLSAMEGLIPLLPRNGIHGLALALGSLASRGLPIIRVPAAQSPDGLHRWRISVDLVGKESGANRAAALDTAEVEIEQEVTMAPCAMVEVEVKGSKEQEGT